ncbi:30S ribosomal protein S8 [Candidatus Uhrbacteria bacterium]|nr:30S ribosomal protein S8 [Candidatus Uhrbacteria bacterium]
MMTDPIADMLTRIRNAQAVGKETVALPASKLKRAIAELLAREGWLARVDTRTAAERRPGSTSPREELLLTLRYWSPGTPRISSIRRVSRPGRRVYVTHGGIPRVKRGTGLAILSTPQGLLTNKEARARKIGGEVICEVY